MAGVKGGDVSGYIERGERGIGNTQTRCVMVVLIRFPIPILNFLNNLVNQVSYKQD